MTACSRARLPSCSAVTWARDAPSSSAREPDSLEDFWCASASSASFSAVAAFCSCSASAREVSEARRCLYTRAAFSDSCVSRRVKVASRSSRAPCARAACSRWTRASSAASLAAFSPPLARRRRSPPRPGPRAPQPPTPSEPLPRPKTPPAASGAPACCCRAAAADEQSWLVSAGSAPGPAPSPPPASGPERRPRTPPHALHPPPQAPPPLGTPPLPSLAPAVGSSLATAHQGILGSACTPGPPPRPPRRPPCARACVRGGLQV